MFEELFTVGFDPPWWEPPLRLVIAMMCGAVLGWDRETRGRDAGLRTHILVGLGAAVFTLLAMELFRTLGGGSLEGSSLQADPTRILEGVVGGIGFIGAGAIIQAGGRIRGLTTAAGIWVTAAIGLTVGAGYYSVAFYTTILAVVTLTILRQLERPLSDRRADDRSGDGSIDTSGGSSDEG